jgi:hypothetical protein
MDNSRPGKHVLRTGQAVPSKNIGDIPSFVVYDDSEGRTWNYASSKLYKF